MAGLALALCGCDLSMSRQPRYQTFRGAAYWPNGVKAEPSPPGALATDAPLDPDPLAARPQMSLALIQRGRERYAIYCTPCHGTFGDGDGRVVARGFPRPPSYNEARLRAAPAEHFVDVIGHGYGVMYAYGDRAPMADRWAIAAYIRTLQLAHGEAGNQDGGRS